jgi:hypothetical protein
MKIGGDDFRLWLIREAAQTGLFLADPFGQPLRLASEKTQIQALSRTQPQLPLRPGLPARRTHDYRRNGLTSLYAAFNVRSGHVVGVPTAAHGD